MDNKNDIRYKYCLLKFKLDDDVRCERFVLRAIVSFANQKVDQLILAELKNILYGGGRKKAITKYARWWGFFFSGLPSPSIVCSLRARKDLRYTGNLSV